MAAPRPYWKGYLKLSLVSCPIAVHSATSSGERVSFRQINKATGHRLKQQLVDEATGDVVSGEDKGRGYEIAKHEYMMVEDEEIDAIAIESSSTIDIDQFVPRAQIDERYLDTPYYITPEGTVGQDAFAVIREAMRGKDLVALGRIVVARRERVVMLQAWEKGILAMTLRYPYEVRDTKTYFDGIIDVKVAPDMLSLAEHILATKTGDFQPATFKDRYEEALVAMLQAKQAGAARKGKPAEVPPGGNVVDLMDALRRSVAGPGKPQDVVKPKKRAPKRIEGQREMLLPIAGKGPPTAVPAVKPAPVAKPGRRTGPATKAG